jgi:carboxymethylenebutenolidase
MDGNTPVASNWIDIRAKDGGTFRAYAARPARGSGPGIVILQEIFGVNANLRRVCDALAEEGYVAIAPDLFWRIEPGVDLDYSDAGRDKGLALKSRMNMELAADDVDSAAAALRRLPETAGKIGAVGYCLGGLLAFVAAARGTVDCAVSYYGVGIETRLDLAPALRVPMTLHYGTDDSHIPPAAIEATRKALADCPGVAFHPYEGCKHGFAGPDRPAFDAPNAAMAHSRTIAALKRVMGPHYNLEDLWEYHIACEFRTQDATETMRTMVPEPYVNHVPTLTGGVGHDMLKRFYKYHFVNQVPRDRKTIPISRTIGADRIVDEKIFCFTHDSPIDWLLPGVPPTGKYVEIPLVGIVTFRGDKLVNEHIYWDQASVLVQIGLLEASGLPVAGREQARKLLDPSHPSNALMTAWQTSEGKPL